jgi:hypothetical protein
MYIHTNISAVDTIKKSNRMIRKKATSRESTSVANQDPGSGAFLAPWIRVSGIHVGKNS